MGEGGDRAWCCNVLRGWQTLSSMKMWWDRPRLSKEVAEQVRGAQGGGC
jgi:hypothetical protein